MPRGRRKKQNHFKHYMDAWVILCGVFLVAVSVIIFAHKSFNAEFSRAGNDLQNLTIPKDMRAWVEIDFGNDTRRRFEGDTVEPPQKLADTLGSISRSSNLSVTVKNNVIFEIGGKQNKTSRWRIYKNGEKTSLPLDELAVVRGDHYALKYER